ncbi:MAG: ABC transporter permease [Acidobacteria bacterium]|nr:MAG: ABC transporter permease [Acidobacteriota bacterium]REK10637.1 MAG: ABC transporter permease [Acidobacteriota bacterium]
MSATPHALRRGPRHWLRSFGLMMLWELRSLRLYLPLAIIVQILLGAGMVVGYGYIIGDVPEPVALYLSTGLAVISMVTIGLVLAPQLIAQQKLAGVYDYMFSLPVPRSTTIAAGLVVNSLIALPGLVIALLVAAWHFDLEFSLRWALLPAVLLTVVTAASIGFAFAHAIQNAQLIGLITQVLIFGLILFSPISFPPERLPGWLAAIHDWLPFFHSANVVRWSLTEDLATDPTRSFVVLSIWAVASWATTAWVVGRRR